MKTPALLAALVALTLTGCAATHPAPQAPFPPKAVEAPTPQPAPPIVCKTGNLMTQTTLYFGLSRHNAAPVSAAQWQSFVDKDVTPRFKDGLSVFDAKGQWLRSEGVVIKENSKALMLIHAADPQEQKKISEIRDIYKQRFKQDSVMQVDNPACVDF
ncbi:DUF3574 domain-containing protein [Rouxiella badensis]|jgi:hypothetical protein|uniref:Ribosomal protein S3 n=1 Tax=Rouxiella badensis TaxID=1646377 RepID=A0A1X0WEY8_9GAMM|nr:DUF3574 domain-containing protein [Rouxiella badensis]MCC3702774.1 DUF3574 domain-containing protein [Rouxiella badensis]MCC3720405.1 DUF3574 domain-containing protein [Rouxiella badensis]MCC3730243.1 DUF3574 domain-containing protein [Rouxiella badensis]MCC3734049.1 DUF3574 domain-containing protein [Rouxiella badensis]MCC3741687.1 DUF3574 domain-containing protein [Rouxiella badensis]